MNSIQIGSRRIGRDEPVFVIAEIGANFSNIDNARRQIDAAAACGCDAVKVQTFRAATLVRQGATFTFEDGSRVSQYDFFRDRELSFDTHIALRDHAASVGLEFFSTPSHESDLELLSAVGVRVHKIGSDDLTNLPFIECIARTGLPTILSTGMSSLGEVEEAVARFTGAGNRNLILLHCVVGYPAPLLETNLRVIQTLAQAFDVPIGFSDHTPGRLAATLAVALGACVVEKHFTLDRSPGGPDNNTSLEPAEMRALVDDIRQVAVAMGDAVKTIRPGEMKWREAARKSLVAARDIRAGERITPETIAVKRPADGIHPRHYWEFVGRTARVDIPADACLTWGAVGESV